MSYTPPKDSEIRSDNGVAVTLSPDENGQTKIILDDVIPLLRVGASHAWEHNGLFTSTSFPTADLEALRVDRDTLALLGENILMRLLTSNKRGSE